MQMSDVQSENEMHVAQLQLMLYWYANKSSESIQLFRRSCAETNLIRHRF
jgi:hypothetical protein